MSNFTVDTFVIDGVPIKISPDLSAILEIVYPVGCVISRVDSENPGELFGFGVWQRLSNNRYIRTGDTETTGGNNEITLTVDNLPAHRHEISASGKHTHSETISKSGVHQHVTTINDSGLHRHTVTIESSGQHSHTASAKITQNKVQPGTQTFQWRTDGESSSTNLVSIGNSGQHTHTGEISQNGSHTHSATTKDSGGHTHEAEISESGEHVHTVSETGSSESFTVEPEFITLAFWKRVE